VGKDGVKMGRKKLKGKGNTPRNKLLVITLDSEYLPFRPLWDISHWLSLLTGNVNLLMTYHFRVRFRVRVMVRFMNRLDRFLANVNSCSRSL